MNKRIPEGKAYIYGENKPGNELWAWLAAYVKKNYGDIEPEFIPEPGMGPGFRLCCGGDTLSWTPRDLLDQLNSRIADISPNGGSVIPLIRDAVKNWIPDIYAKESGVVLSAGDGIAKLSGLSRARYGEILLFEGGIRGMVQEIRENSISCILFGDYELVREGSEVMRTGKTAGVPVGEGLLGRVVDGLGSPIDGKGDIESSGYFPLERPAPGIIERQPVNTPLETGILAIDSMFPIGRGQRELIIGDRQTGKTSIAMDAILNQKGKNVVCIYVAIGQKASSVAQSVELLRKGGAMEYTIVVCAGAGDSASMQYAAPYAGCAMGEYFMEKGRDVLIVYDDLSKHAVAYRTVSLLLGRSPGREAYPGDVFYLHSRLLERSARLSSGLGGGSMTALPIVETLAGDVSAYIPTNIISITDGQIFLESGLFFAGQRPAGNIGLSVSRVGGAAQSQAMKQAVGSLRLSLAQYKEMEIFTQFSSDLDQSTKEQLEYGRSLMEILRQKRSSPFSLWQQVVLLLSAEGHIFEKLPCKEISSFRQYLLSGFAACSDITDRLQSGAALTDELRRDVLYKAQALLAAYTAGGAS